MLGNVGDGAAHLPGKTGDRVEMPQRLAPVADPVHAAVAVPEPVFDLEGADAAARIFLKGQKTRAVLLDDPLDRDGAQIHEVLHFDIENAKRLV